MKQFFKILFASLLGAILGIVLLCFIFVGIIVAISGAQVSSLGIKEPTVLVLNDVISIGETTSPYTPALMNSLNTESTIGLYDALDALDRAAHDENIKGIVLNDVIFNAGYASIEELAEGLTQFKKSGKFVKGYFSTLSQKTYLVASACDEIVMNAEGMAEFRGISASSVHYKQLLEKVGLEPVVIRCGKYKSFVESVMNDKMSPENKEQTQAYIENTWKKYETAACSRRGINASQLNSFADSGLICIPRELLSFGFIDKIEHADEFWNEIHEIAGIDKDKKIPTVTLRTYIEENASLVTDTTTNNNIALVIAEGSIDTGKESNGSIGSSAYVKMLRDVRKDSSIQAVVLRINSGGGSALASELIWREVALTAEAKPLIVSMGDAAASGGYYIATPATKIVASPMTLTGSIGVFGMSMTAENLLKKIGVSVDKTNTHSHSDFGSIDHTMDVTEMHALEKSIDKTYDTFKKRVADGRNISLDTVEKIAQGRIWSASDALRIGLVDTIGSMQSAIDIAKSYCSTEDVGVKVYPKQQTIYDLLMEQFNSQASVFEKMTTDEQLLDILKHIPTEDGIFTQVPFYMTVE